MFVFTRVKDQKTVIDDNIVVTVVSLRGERVRLGIEAFKDAKVARGEMAAEGQSLPGRPETRPT